MTSHSTSSPLVAGLIVNASTESLSQFSSNDVTHEWLTGRLRENGFLASGRVTDVERSRTAETLYSHLAYFQLEYSSESPRSAPRRLLLKFSKPSEDRINEREVDFYRRIAPRMLRASIPVCYDASYDETENRYYLLLEDLSATHYQIEYPLPPTQIQAEQIVDTLADFHACWWDHALLGQEAGELPDDRAVNEYVARLSTAFEEFADYFDDRLSQPVRELYSWTFAHYARLLVSRCRAAQHLTFVHGDMHSWNCLLPRASGQFPVLIDWYTHHNIWRCSIGPMDIATWIIPWWSTERRQQLEMTLLRRYWERLKDLGVEDYDWDRLMTDYRLAALTCLFWPLTEWGRTSSMRWLPWLEKTTSALIQLGYHDLTADLVSER